MANPGVPHTTGYRRGIPGVWWSFGSGLKTKGRTWTTRVDLSRDLCNNRRCGPVTTLPVAPFARSLSKGKTGGRSALSLRVRFCSRPFCRWRAGLLQCLAL